MNKVKDFKSVEEQFISSTEIFIKDINNERNK